MNILVTFFSIFFVATISFAESDFIFSNWAGDIELSSVYQNEYSPSIDRNSGESNSYLNFDGVDDYLDIPASSDYDFSDEDAFSLSFWVNFNDVSSVQYIFSAEDMFWVFLNDDGEIKFRYRNHPSGNWPEISSSFSPQIETWYHILISTDNGSSKIYINGSLDEESNVSISGLTSNGNNTRNLELGARKNYSSDPQYFLNGSLDDVAIWNKSIPGSEVNAIYNHVNLSSNSFGYNSSSDLVCYWRFNEGQGSTANDLSLNNNNAVIIGASWNEENASSIKVAVVSSPNSYSTKELVAAQLNDDTYFDFSAVTLTVDQADEISEISDYDVIIIGGSGHGDGGYTSSFYSTLNTYMLNGGGILSTGWFYHELLMTGYTNNDYVSSVTPFVHNGSYQYGSPGQISIVQNDHPVTNGISNFTPTCSNTEYAITIDQGAEKLGGLIGVNNSNTIIVHDHGIYGRTGYLGGMYIAKTTYNNGNMRSGVEDQLLEQMVYWLAGGESNQIEFKPTTKAELQTAVDLWVSDNSAALSTYGMINSWDVSLIADMSELFMDKTTFNDDIGNWDVSNVTNMTRMFQTCRYFNQDISGWDVSSLTNMTSMFHDSWNFNQDISSWDVSSVTSLRMTFEDTRKFNQDISSWDVSSVIDMGLTFVRALDFNQDISSWDVSNVTDMDYLFWSATSFDQDISAWDVSNVTTMVEMFYSASGLSDTNKCLIHASFQSNDAWAPNNWSYLCNTAPTASDQYLTIFEDNTFDFPFSSEDTDNDFLVYEIIDSSKHGNINISLDTGFVYTPFNNFFGLDSFKYVAYDGEAYSEPAMVTIEVTEVNDKPMAMSDHFMLAEDDTLHGELQANDGDYFTIQQEIQDLTYSITLSTLKGTLSVIDTSGEFTYTPDANFFGADSFLFSVTDNGTTDGVADFRSDTAMIHLFVEPMNDAPVLSAFADTSMHEDSTLVLSIFANDIDNAELSVYAYSSQDRVSAFVEDTLLYINPDADWNGTVEIVVVANDNMSRASDAKEFTVEVVPVNDPPFFTMNHFHAMGDITSGLEHWLYADDIDSDIFFTLEGAPSWISLDGSKIVGQPEQDGEYVFTLSVSDSEYVVSEQFTVYIADHRPEILSLRDVANDQGKQMQIVWKPGQLDPSLLFTQFSAWRKVNPEPDIVYFTKENNADWTLEQNQDRISETVWLTRASNQGIFNIFSQDSYDPNGPSGTSWRWGATLDESHSDLAYTSLNAAILQSGYNVNQTLVQQLAGNPVFSLYLIDNDEYYDVTFTSYFGNNSGGGFSWYHSPVEFQADTSDLWDFIATIPWIGTEDEYSLVVPTLGDSTTHGVHHSTFRVTAHTEDVVLYHVSEPVTGFSVDNLHPTVPQGLTALESGSSVILQWNTQVDEDFSYHNIYKNDLNSADLAMVFTTTDSFYVDQEGTQGSYEYWITAVDSAGNESDASDIAAAVLSSSEQVTLPTVFALEQNYPNPFNPSTQIRYAIPEQSMVTISIYDMMGRKVRTLIQGNISAGYHTTVWNATNDKGLPVGAGMYIYTIRAGTYHQMKKMVLLK
jgi:surface protein